MLDSKKVCKKTSKARELIIWRVHCWANKKYFFVKETKSATFVYFIFVFFYVFLTNCKIVFQPGKSPDISFLGHFSKLLIFFILFTHLYNILIKGKIHIYSSSCMKVSDAIILRSLKHCKLFELSPSAMENPLKSNWPFHWWRATGLNYNEFILKENFVVYWFFFQNYFPCLHVWLWCTCYKLVYWHG